MNNVFLRAEKIAEFLKLKIKDIPDTLVVLGSGLGNFGEEIEKDKEIFYKDIPDFPVSTVKGHAGKLVFGRVNGKPIIAMQGRFHLYEGYTTEDVTLYIRVFSLLGLKNIILTNAAGAINSSFKAGELMLIADHISLFCKNPLTGPNDERFGPRFPSMSNAYDNDLRFLAKETALELCIKLEEGVYCYTSGPCYETPAEIRALKILGADACGMSTVPETIVANHCGIRVLGISCLTNMAAGITDKPLNHEEVIKTSKTAEKDFKALIKGICSKLRGERWT